MFAKSKRAKELPFRQAATLGAQYIADALKVNTALTSLKYIRSLSCFVSTSSLHPLPLLSADRTIRLSFAVSMAPLSKS